jgi:hypothetical protein
MRPVAEAKRDWVEMFVEYTKSICPVCKVVVDAQVNPPHRYKSRAEQRRSASTVAEANFLVVNQSAA